MIARSIVLTAALSSSVVLAQEPRTGVSQPEQDAVLTTQDAPQQTSTGAHAVAPPAAPPAKAEVYGPYVPFGSAAHADDAGAELRAQDADSGIVTTVEERTGELREGTLLRARMLQGLSTATAEPGTDFTASLAEPVMKDGRVLLPTGALLHGRVTGVHSGKRISGPAMLHLQAKYVDLPDGSRFPVHAILIDTDQTSRTKVDREGSLVRRDHPKETFAAMGLAVGGATTAGAMLGGGVGALVGVGVGAGAGTIVWLRQDRQASLPANTILVFSLSSPMSTEPQTAVNVPAKAVSSDALVVGDSEPISR